MTLQREDIRYFQSRIYDYYQESGRNFPWRLTRDAYEILISEIMLQQTQTDRVVPKYYAFLDRFPNVEKLAAASLADVLKMWQGLGYNRRARYLHECAKKLVSDYDGVLPESADELKKLPGIGPYTASAVATFAFSKPEVFIETNIRSVYLYSFFPSQENVSDNELLEVIAQTLDRENPRDWYYALMDYGVYIKKTHGNVNYRSKHYSKQSKFVGSDRQLRGQLITYLLESPITVAKASEQFGSTPERVQKILEKLSNEGMVHEQDGRYHIHE